MTERTGGYTGSQKYEIAGIVHYGEGYLPCSCGGVMRYQNSAEGTTYSHNEPFAPWNEHLFVIPGQGTAVLG